MLLFICPSSYFFNVYIKDKSIIYLYFDCDCSDIDTKYYISKDIRIFISNIMVMYYEQGRAKHRGVQLFRTRLSCGDCGNMFENRVVASSVKDAKGSCLRLCAGCALKTGGRLGSMNTDCSLDRMEREGSTDLPRAVRSRPSDCPVASPSTEFDASRTHGETYDKALDALFSMKVMMAR